MARRAREPARIQAEMEREYRQAVANFATTIIAIQTISRASAGRQAGPKRAWASVLFTRICTYSISIQRLIPTLATDGAAEDEHWDLSSIATLTRSILECSLLFYYLGVQDVAEDEWADRMNLIHLHDCSARIPLFQHLLPNPSEVEKFEKVQIELRARLEASPRISQLPEPRRNHLLRGDKVTFEIQDDILAAMGVDRDIFRAWYRVLSAHTHSYPLAFHRMIEGDRGRGVEGRVDRNWITYTLEYLQGFLARAATQMLSLFPDVPDPRLPPQFR